MQHKARTLQSLADYRPGNKRFVTCSLHASAQGDLAACNAVLRTLLQPQRIAALAQRLWLALPAAMPADSGDAEACVLFTQRSCRQ